MRQSAPITLAAKILVIGDANTGKTSLLFRLCEDRYGFKQVPTIGIDFKVKEITVDGRKVRLKIWDTAGQERYRNITDAYYKGADGVVLMYACDNRQSFENIGVWMQQIDNHSGPNVAKILVGNKKDVSPREVTFEEGQRLAATYNIKFLETSAKENENVTEVFSMIAKLIFHDTFTKLRQSFGLKKDPGPPDTDGSKCC